MIHRLLIAAFFCASLLPFSAFCEADVVDDSENFALLEEQQATNASPAVHDSKKQSYFAKDESALAKDDKQIGKNSNAGILDKVQGLQQEIQELRGQLEVQAHDMKLLQEQELSFYKDLDARLRGAPAKSIASASTTELSMGNTKPLTPSTTLLDDDSAAQSIKDDSATQSTQSPIQPIVPNTTPAIQPILTGGQVVNPAEEQINYLAAYELVKNKHFDLALPAMHAFVTKYPHGGYSANAQYWLGELYIIQKNYPQAIEHFNVVLKSFPSSSKCAPSLLKVGFALAASGRKDEARAKLQDVVKKYPDTSAAKMATTKLKSL